MYKNITNSANNTKTCQQIIRKHAMETLYLLFGSTYSSTPVMPESVCVCDLHQIPHCAPLLQRGIFPCLNYRYKLLYNNVELKKRLTT